MLRLHPMIKIPELKLSPKVLRHNNCSWRISVSSGVCKNPEFEETPDSIDGYIQLHPVKIDLPPIRKRNSFHKISIVPQPYHDNDF
jgi:hypothetical protein